MDAIQTVTQQRRTHQGGLN